MNIEFLSFPFIFGGIIAGFILFAIADTLFATKAMSVNHISCGHLLPLRELPATCYHVREELENEVNIYDACSYGCMRKINKYYE